MDIKLTAIILAKNEEENIKKCLESIKFCDEILVIDDNSTDKTVEIIQNSKGKSQNYKSKVKILKRHLNGDFAGQRNFALRQAQGQWVLFIDSDEIVSEALASEIVNYKLSITNYSGFYIKRKDFWKGKEIKYGETGNIKLLRLARKNAGQWIRPVHEAWDVKGSASRRIGILKNSILHYPHPTLREFINEINQYSTLHAKSNLREGKKSSIWKIIFWPKGKFIYNWIFKLGFLDGTEGFIIALMMSFHSFLAWSKAWLSKETK
jgi:glycosyltransferase involved in cell wall biosynthesis